MENLEINEEVNDLNKKSNLEIYNEKNYFEMIKNEKKDNLGERKKDLKHFLRFTNNISHFLISNKFQIWKKSKNEICEKKIIYKKQDLKRKKFNLNYNKLGNKTDNYNKLKFNHKKFCLII